MLGLEDAVEAFLQRVPGATRASASFSGWSPPGTVDHPGIVPGMSGAPAGPTP